MNPIRYYPPTASMPQRSSASAMFIASPSQVNQTPSGAACLGWAMGSTHMPLLTELADSMGTLVSINMALHTELEFPGEPRCYLSTSHKA